jgi:molybdate transport system regulatory protein
MDENTHNPRHKRRSPEHVGFKDAPLGELRIGGRVWIEKEGATYIAWGRVVLLEHIERSGSISAAARSMGISYRHAWLLVEQMNKLSLMPLVSAKKGGNRGGGASLTPYGKSVVQGFWLLVQKFESCLKEASEDERLSSLLLPTLKA